MRLASTCGLRRHPVAHLDAIDEQVEELIRNDFVEPAASPWASNVVLVRKKDGFHRLCVDYRAVNEATYKRFVSSSAYRYVLGLDEWSSLVFYVRSAVRLPRNSNQES